MAISGLLLAGCAGTPTTGAAYPSASDVASLPADIADLPQVTLADGTAAEAKALAMGAARSKGWAVSGSGVDRLIAQRPVDASTLPGAGVAPGSTLEVTSFFIEQPGGTNVATKAEVVSPALGGRPATRIDYTDSFRDPLIQSLDSLRESWASNRVRVTRATPPKEGWADPWAGTPYARAKPEPGVETTDAPGPASAEEPDATRGPVPDARPAPAYAERQAPASTPAPRQTTRTEPGISEPRTAERDVASAPARRQTTAPGSDSMRPTPEPRRRPAAAPAPVVDASSGLGTRGTTGSATYSTAPITQRENMMALPASQMAAVTSVNWSAYAEQYARQRGCQVSGSGSQLIESRQDGEIHKVPCEGSDSFLVKCQNGTCQGLL